VEIDFEAVRRVFLAEVEEHLGQMELALLGLEAAPDSREAVDTLFRGAHSIKGSAATLGFDALADLGHAVEDVLARLRARSLAVGPALVTLLLSTVDALRRLLPASSAEQRLGPDALRLLARLRRLAAAPHVPGGGVDEAPAATAATPPAATAARARTLRVDVERLERMLDTAGETLVALARLRPLLEARSARGDGEALGAFESAERLAVELHELVLQARLVPVGATLRRFARPVRDLAQAAGKQARLVVEGEQTELDLTLIEAIRDPLTHMVRNAIDHGLEPPDARRAAGKDETGSVTLRARHEAAGVVIEAQDDGAGVPLEALRRRARELGLHADPERAGEAELIELIFRPGFSTSERVTDLSGRGVGMDVVRRNVEALQGSVAVETRAGVGTRVTLRLPLTLVLVEGFSVDVADQRYVVPLHALAECFDLPAGALAGERDEGVVDLRGEPLPVLRLRRLFGLPGQAAARESVVVVRHAAGRAGLVVDRLLGQGRAVLKPLGRLFRGAAGVLGTSLTADGQVALVLDVPGLLRERLGRAPIRLEAR
jgi:two-component system chemotaxis sensor kinase CheA